MKENTTFGPSQQLKLNLFQLFNCFIVAALVEQRTNPVQVVRKVLASGIQRFFDILLESLRVQFNISNGLGYLHLAVSQLLAHVSPPGRSQNQLKD